MCQMHMHIHKEMVHDDGARIRVFLEKNLSLMQDVDVTMK